MDTTLVHEKLHHVHVALLCDCVISGSSVFILLIMITIIYYLYQQMLIYIHIKILNYITNALSCFSASVPSSGSFNIVFASHKILILLKLHKTVGRFMIKCGSGCICARNTKTLLLNCTCSHYHILSTVQILYYNDLQFHVILIILILYNFSKHNIKAP